MRLIVKLRLRLEAKAQGKGLRPRFEAKVRDYSWRLRLENNT